MYKRKINAFEKALLIVGLLVIILGYFFIQRLLLANGLNVYTLQTIFLWLLVILMVILVTVCENMKEELKLIAENQIRETKLLRDAIIRKR